MRQPTRIVRLTTIAFAATALLAGCLSKALSKKEAGEIISTSSAFNRPKFAHIPRQMTFRGYAFSSNGVLSINDMAQFDPTMAILKLQRVITVNESVYGSGVETLHQLVITPTAIDSTSLLADEDPRSGGYDVQATLDAQEERRDNFSRLGYYSSFKKDLGWRVPIGTRQFIEVTQIHNWRDANENIPVNEIVVDFTWRWVPNDFGDAFDTQSATFRSFPDEVQRAAESWGVRMNTEGTMLSRAYLRREDKQWQLTVIHWSTGRGNPR
jgi:hypothetical protein